MNINREELLKQLEAVMPGLSTREIIEQSSCFIFKDKTVSTFNDEIACSQKTSLDIEGAVQAMPLISLLRKMKEDELEINISNKKSQLLVRGGGGRRAGIQMEQDITLLIEEIDKPKKWKSLPDGFTDAVTTVQDCAGKNESQFILTCIHIDSRWVEACDNHQVARYKIKTDIKKPTLIRKESIKYIKDLDMTKFSETRNWIHFKNSTGLILSCRHFLVSTDDSDDEKECYPTNDITKVLKVKGEPLILPKGLKKAIEKAEIFSSENVESNDLIIDLKPGKFKITGKGISGWYKEPKKSKYKGRTLQFTIPSKMLLEIVNKHSECVISSSHLKITGKNFVYVTALGIIEEKEK